MSTSFLLHLLQAKPRLAGKVRLQTDKISGNQVLLYPEGVVLLNTTGEAIVRLCDGSHSFQRILALLAERYNTTPEQLEDDVSEYLYTLYEQCLIELPEKGGDGSEKDFQYE